MIIGDHVVGTWGEWVKQPRSQDFSIVTREKVQGMRLGLKEGLTVFVIRMEWC